jgi:hypothetical protein
VDIKKADAIRVDAYAVSIIIRLIAFLSFVVTIYFTYKAESLGWSLGLNTSSNPFPWIIFAAGSFASLMIFGIGLTLAMLCAVYDRQEIKFVRPAPQVLREVASPKPESTWPLRYVVAEKESTGAFPSSKVVTPTATDDGDSTKERSVLWDQLKRERHFRKPSDE